MNILSLLIGISIGFIVSGFCACVVLTGVTRQLNDLIESFNDIKNRVDRVFTALIDNPRDDVVESIEKNARKKRTMWDLPEKRLERGND